MNFIRVLELAVVFLLVFFFVWQVLIPLIRNRPLFPIFRPERKLMADLDAAQAARNEEKIKAAAEDLRNK